MCCRSRLLPVVAVFLPLLSVWSCQAFDKNPNQKSRTAGGDIAQSESLPEYVGWDDIVTAEVITAAEQRLKNLTEDRMSNSAVVRGELKLRALPYSVKQSLRETVVDSNSTAYAILGSKEETGMSASAKLKLAERGLNVGASIGVKEIRGGAISVTLGVRWGFENTTVNNISGNYPWFQCLASSNVSNAIGREAKWNLEASSGVGFSQGVFDDLLGLSANWARYQGITAILENKWDMTIKSAEYYLANDKPVDANLALYLMNRYCLAWLNGSEGHLTQEFIHQSDQKFLDAFFGDQSNFMALVVKDFSLDQQGSLGAALVDATYAAYMTQFALPVLAARTGQEVKGCTYDPNYHTENYAVSGLSEDPVCSYEWMDNQIKNQTREDPVIMNVMISHTDYALAGLKPYCKQNRPSTKVTLDGTTYLSPQTSGHCVIIQTRKNYPCSLWQSEDGRTETHKPNFVFNLRKLNYASLSGARKLTPRNLAPLAYRYDWQEINGLHSYVGNNVIGPDPDIELDVSGREKLSEIMTKDPRLYNFNPYIAEGECAPNLKCVQYSKVDFEDITQSSFGLSSGDQWPDSAGICQ